MKLLLESDRLEAARAIRIPRPLANPVILLAEADPRLFALTERMLVQRGCEVDGAQDGFEGWKALLTQPYDLLITGRELRGLGALELVKRIHSARMRLPIIFTSPTLGMEALNHYTGPAIHAVLPESFTQQDLLTTVDYVLLPTNRELENGLSSRTSFQEAARREPWMHWGINE